MPSALILHTSNRLERLSAALAEVLETPLSSPLATETIVVQSKGMERWLSLQLADRRGIWANYRFPFPNALIRELLGSVLGAADENPLLQPEILAWRLYELLPNVLSRPIFAPLAAYLVVAPGEPLRRWHLCRQIADLFDQYLVYRHQLIQTWESGRLSGCGGHEAWQAELWRLLTPAGSLPHRAQLVDTFCQRLADNAPLTTPLPERISLFGVTTLPPLHLQVLASIAALTEVHLYLLNPCAGYWFDLKTPQEEAATRRRGAADGVSDEDLWLASGHPLLAALGKSGRDLFSRLFDCVVTTAEDFDATTDRTLLGRLQNDILHGQDWPPAEPFIAAPSDQSLTLHACYGPLREVEALHDLLVQAFRDIDDLSPRDVLVMAPDIELYAPLIEAVFSAERNGRRLIPFAISDRGSAAGSFLQQGLQRLFALPAGRRGAAEILDLIELEPVARQFSFSDDDLATIRDWIETLGLCWGFDAADRARSGAPEEELFTWRAGLDRLLLGLALPEDDLFAGRLPCAAATAAPDLLGRLCDLIELLAIWCDDAGCTCTLPEWRDRLHRLLDDFFDPGDAGHELLRLHRAVDTVVAEGATAGVTGNVPFAVVQSRLQSLLAERSATGFLSGPVTFCTLQPMRSVPFRIVALIGMNDNDFPRNSRTPGFDLMRRHPLAGDPSRRNEDRYLFLEALLSARDRLIVTWQGKSPRDNKERNPSVVIGELRDTLAATLAGGRDALAAFVKEHPLQPFSPGLYTPGATVAGASIDWYEAIVAARTRSDKVAPFCPAPLPAPEPVETLTLVELLRFWRQPAEYFLRRRLSLRLTTPDEGIDEREPFALNGLDRYRLGTELTRALLDTVDPALCARRAAAAGDLPAGPMGEGNWRQLAAEAVPFAQQLQPLLGEGDPRVFSLAFDELLLSGELSPPGRKGRLSWRFARLKAKDRLNAWIQHLCACALGEAIPTLLAGRGELRRYAPLSAAEALDHLSVMTGYYRRGLTRPIPFFPESSLAWAAALYAGRDDDAARSAAVKVWAANYSSRGEESDPYYRLAFPVDPFDAEFAALAALVWTPLLAAEEEG